MNKNNSIRTILSAALLIAASATAFAQGNGLAGINEATSMVTSYFDPGTKLIYAIGAVVGLIGGVLGGWLFSPVGPAPIGSLGSLATSVIGAVALLWIAAVITRKKIR